MSEPRPTKHYTVLLEVTGSSQRTWILEVYYLSIVLFSAYIALNHLGSLSASDILSFFALLSSVSVPAGLYLWLP